VQYLQYSTVFTVHEINTKNIKDIKIYIQSQYWAVTTLCLEILQLQESFLNMQW
jgi:hypothetical protein